MKAEEVERVISEALDRVLPRILKEQKKDEKMNDNKKPTGKSVKKKEPVTLFGKQRGRRNEHNLYKYC